MTPVAIPPLPFLPEAVVFDMDGLMLDSERAINDCMARAASDLGHDLPASLWLQMIGGGDGLCRRLLAERIGADATMELLARAEAMYDVVADAGIDHRFGQQEHIGRAAAGDCGDRVHLRFVVDPHGLARSREQRLGEIGGQHALQVVSVAAFEQVHVEGVTHHQRWQVGE